MLGNKWFDDQRVGEVSTRNGRGKHTTRNVSLLPLCGGGYLADTPGFNQPSLLKVTKHSLAHCFPEIRNMIEGEKCEFENCSHIEVQGDWDRYPYYLKLLNEIKIDEESQLKKYGTKREAGFRYLFDSPKTRDWSQPKYGLIRESLTQVQDGRREGEKRVEPRIDPWKYRRPSRKTMKQAMMTELEY